MRIVLGLLSIVVVNWLFFSHGIKTRTAVIKMCEMSLKKVEIANGGAAVASELSETLAKIISDPLWQACNSGGK